MQMPDFGFKFFDGLTGFNGGGTCQAAYTVAKHLSFYKAIDGAFLSC